VAEQRYQAVLAVISGGETVTDVAARFGVARKTVHAWLAKYEAGGIENLGDGSHRPRSCPHQIGSLVEVEIARLRTAHPSWGPRRLVFELAKQDVVVSELAVCRALVRLSLIDPSGRRRRDRKWKRWERGTAMELWQMDVVGGFVLADSTRAKALSGVDDHSRFCISAHLMVRETSGNVCQGLAKALSSYGVVTQILTDNGKVFTGRFGRPVVEVLFDRICRENGIEHLLTQPRSPTTTGKIEWFHRALRTEFRTDRVFASLAMAQTELDEWVEDDNHRRPHQGLDMAFPADRFLPHDAAAVTELRPHQHRRSTRTHPRGRDLGGPPGQRRRGGLRPVATGLPRHRSCRPKYRRVGHRPGPAVLRQRQAPTHRATTDPRRGQEEAGIDPRWPH
jgi:transposase InsO family protein